MADCPHDRSPSTQVPTCRTKVAPGRRLAEDAWRWTPALTLSLMPASGHLSVQSYSSYARHQYYESWRCQASTVDDITGALDPKGEADDHCRHAHNFSDCTVVCFGRLQSCNQRSAILVSLTPRVKLTTTACMRASSFIEPCHILSQLQSCSHTMALDHKYESNNLWGCMHTLEPI